MLERSRRRAYSASTTQEAASAARHAGSGDHIVVMAQSLVLTSLSRMSYAK